MYNAQEIAGVIEIFAKKKGIKVSEILKNCNLSERVISNMKAGSMPSVDKLAIIAQYLDVSVEYLLGLTDDPSPPQKKTPPTLEDAKRIYDALVDNKVINPGEKLNDKQMQILSGFFRNISELINFNSDKSND